MDYLTPYQLYQLDKYGDILPETETLPFSYTEGPVDERSWEEAQRELLPENIPSNYSK